MTGMASTCGLLLLFVLAPTAYGQDYCSFTPDHTMCKYSGFGPACGSEAPITTLTEEEKKVIVKEHNKLRSRVATGEEDLGAPGPQPSSSNMREFAWDDELAKVAQMFVNQCVYGHDCWACRKVERFGVGQNSYHGSRWSNDGAPDWAGAVKMWYGEVKDFPKTAVDPFIWATSYGHYSQVVWAETYRVGCGIAIYPQGSMFSYLQVCNYGPGGNMETVPMYKIGEPCSACPAGTACSKENPGLCAEM